MAVEIIEELSERPWSQTERWLYTRHFGVERIARRAKESIDIQAEDRLWQVEVPQELRPTEDGYFLDLMVNWTGPASKDSRLSAPKNLKNSTH